MFRRIRGFPIRSFARRHRWAVGTSSTRRSLAGSRHQNTQHRHGSPFVYLLPMPRMRPTALSLVLAILAALAASCGLAAGSPVVPPRATVVFKRSCSECDEAVGVFCEFGHPGAPPGSVACVDYGAEEGNEGVLYRRYAAPVAGGETAWTSSSKATETTVTTGETSTSATTSATCTPTVLPGCASLGDPTADRVVLSSSAETARGTVTSGGTALGAFTQQPDYLGFMGYCANPDPGTEFRLEFAMPTAFVCSNFSAGTAFSPTQAASGTPETSNFGLAFCTIDGANTSPGSFRMTRFDATEVTKSSFTYVTQGTVRLSATFVGSYLLPGGTYDSFNLTLSGVAEMAREVPVFNSSWVMRYGGSIAVAKSSAEVRALEDCRVPATTTTAVTTTVSATTSETAVASSTSSIATPE
ncbi:hypothetical protein DFJ74DRAFT_769395 [Hyaloraphidium curvatum]|nr:hypothetical protein DFJ74DRAFT_769395 [Hyaloraphidium curvatum]